MLIKNKNIYIFLFLIILFFISALPISDADSLVYFNIPKQIYNFGKIFSDISYFESRLISSSEIFLSLSFAFYSDNYGSIINSVSLFFLCTTLIKDKKINSVIFIISTPLIIYFISTQKLQIFFAILYLVIFLFINSIKKFSNLNILIITLLIVFFASGKISNVLIAIPISFYLFYKIYKKYFFITIFFFILNFVLIFLPILLKKIEIYGDPFSPFFEHLKRNPDLTIIQFSENLRRSQGWLGEQNFISVIISILKIFIPTSLANLSNTLGLGALLIFYIKFCKFKKESYWLSISNVILILSTGQILPRYFLESFMLLSLNFNFLRLNKLKRIFLLIFKIKILIIMIIGLTYILYCLYLLYPFFSKKKYLEKLAFTYSYAYELNKFNLKENILSFDISRKTIFFEKNFFPINSLLLNDNISINLINFIKINNIKYLISQNNNFNIKKCLNLELIGNFSSYDNVSRNFFSSPKEKNNYIYRILGFNRNCEING